jgi:trehalose-phosphatase
MNGHYGTLWTFDFDGTLSPLVPDRSQARLDPGCAERLAELNSIDENVVAVVSSRSLEDLEPRVPISGALLAGSCGLEWRLPDGSYIRPSAHTTERVALEKERVLRALESIQSISGVDTEVKPWSIAVHFRKTDERDLGTVLKELELLKFLPGVRLYFGPKVAEIQLIEEINKVTAVRMLSRLFEREYPEPLVVYAGDDQNDVQAMRWVLERRGIAFTVGDRIAVKGAIAVADPSDLARIIRTRILSPTAL